MGEGELGMNHDGCYCLYTGSDPYRPTDLGKQMEAMGSDIHIVVVDTQIGGKVHDLTRRGEWQLI